MDTNTLTKQKGSIFIFLVVIIFIFSLVMLGLMSYATMELRVTRSSINREQAFQIAEAGINYYEWHLANFPNDFWDGNASTTSGPYVHNYLDSSNNQIIGKFSLTITPPPTGSTVTTIQSNGYTLAAPGTDRTIVVRYGIPSLAQYAFLTNSDAWIGENETINGQFFTNGGLRFDGTGNAPIMSAKSTYTCQSWSGSPCPANKNGIWGSATQSTKNFWQYPVPNTDFSAITANLATMKSSAQSSGIYLLPSGGSGYSLVFKSDGTVDIYKVTSLKSDPNGKDVNGTVHSENIDWSTRSWQSNKPIPANGIIYVEDNTWVEGTVKGRVMVAAAVLPQPTNPPDIIIQNNITYLAKDGTNSLGLIAQGDFLIGYTAPSNLEIDGAIVSQTGSAQIYDFGSVKDTITIFGAVASYGVWTWTWVDGGGNTISGYANTVTVYDANLLYSPPPSFPLSNSGYQQISWNGY